MLYLLDANVVIEPYQTYYPPDRIPQYWTWLAQVCIDGHAKIPLEIYGEIQPRSGPLHDWMRSVGTKDRIVLNEAADPGLVERVLTAGYAPDLSSEEIATIGQDAMLIAYAMNDRDRIVVSQESSKPSAQRQNRKVPDVCATLGVTCINAYAWFSAMDFHTRPS